MMGDVQFTFCLSFVSLLNNKPVNALGFFRSEDFELSANLLAVHIETHGKLILKTQVDSHCELAVGFPWVCISHGELAVSYS